MTPLRVFFLSSEGEARYTQCVNRHYISADLSVPTSVSQIPHVDPNFTVAGSCIVKFFAKAAGGGKEKQRYKVYVRYPVCRRRGNSWGGEVVVVKGSHDGLGFVNMRKGDGAIAKQLIRKYVENLSGATLFSSQISASYSMTGVHFLRVFRRRAVLFAQRSYELWQVDNE